jgi:hypothetical protein
MSINLAYRACETLSVLLGIAVFATGKAGYQELHWVLAGLALAFSAGAVHYGGILDRRRSW